MEMEQKYNTRNPAVKRLMREACELTDATEEYCARPLDDNLFEWHFTVHGSPGTEYEGGVYHGRILLPPEYPMKPPNIILLTPNGRFETNKKICLSISGHHPETWQPSWSIRTALLALIAFMSSPGNGAIGSLDYTPDERRILAKKSQNWSCPECGKIILLLCSSNSKPITEEETNIISQIALKAEESLPAKTTENESSEVDAEIAEVLKDIGDLNEEFNRAISHYENSEVTSEIRQRVTNQDEVNIEQENIVQQDTNVSSESDITIIFIWIIVAAIILLLARRIFLM